MDLKTLIHDAHEIAKSKGWHDETVPFEVSIANIHAELSETWEEWRNNKGLDEIYFECSAKNLEPCQTAEGDCGPCTHRKPCGIPVELADVVIRICDTFGQYQFNIDSLVPYRLGYVLDGLADLINVGHGYLFQQGKLGCAASFKYLIGLIIEIEEFCKENNIPFDRAIELKMEHNRHRSYRHNGKRA